MRLQEMFFICKSALEQLPNFITSTTLVGSTSFYEIQDWSIIDSILIDLYQVHGMRDPIDHFRSSSKTMLPGTERTLLSSSEHINAKNAYHVLEVALQTVVNAYASFQIPEHSEGIDIRLPDHVTLDQLSKISGDMSKTFEQCPILHLDNSSISLVAMDVGSMWLSFVAIGAYALNRIAAFVDKCMVIKSHLLSLRAQENQAKRMGMADKYIEDMMDMHKEFTRKVSRTLAENLCSDYEINDNEEIERTRYSIELFGELMSQGVEVYASVQASKEAQVLFPTVEQQSISGKFLEALTEKSSTQPDDPDKED